MTIKISGTHTVMSMEAMVVTIPETNLASGISITVNANARWNIAAYTITASPTDLDFGSAMTGYMPPEAQTVTITNTGNQDVTLDMPTAGTASYTIGALSANTIAPNETATFTSQPVAGLPAGTYDDTITVTGTGGAIATVTVSFTVNEPAPIPPIITSPTEDQSITVTKGDTVTMEVTASYATGYQWYVNNNDGNGFVEIPEATDTNYTTAALALTDDGQQFYCVATDDGGTATSPVFTLDVVEAIDVPATGDNSMPGLCIMHHGGCGRHIAPVRRKKT